jgi:hypothetical protein
MSAKIPFNIVLSPKLASPKWYLPFRFFEKIYFTFPMHITCPVRIILLDLITIIIFGEEQKLRNSSLYSVTTLPLFPLS